MFYIKQNDTSPALEVTLQDSDGNPVNVFGASVEFHMRPQANDTVKVSSPGEVVDGPAGIVRYNWSTGDTDTPGDFWAEFQITYSDSTIETFPNTTYIEVKILEEIA